MIHTSDIDTLKILKRLEVIKSLILLEEVIDIDSHILKIETLYNTIEINTILDFLKQKAYCKAIIAIEDYINQYNKLNNYFDPELNALKLEIKILESEINFLSDEKADVEKLIHEFYIRHNKELGELIIKILKSRKEKAKNTPFEEETEADFNNYHKEYEATKNETIVRLTEKEKNELKVTYREATKLCHPDVVSEEYKESAKKIFIELNEAYERNELHKVIEIYKNLKNGCFFIKKSDVLNEKEHLNTAILKLHKYIKELKLQIQTIKNSEVYKTIVCIDDWDFYFEDAKNRLKAKLKETTS